MLPADGFQWDALTLAKQALSASKQAAAVAQELKLVKIDDDDSLPLGLVLALASLIWLFICLYVILLRIMPKICDSDWPTLHLERTKS